MNYRTSAEGIFEAIWRTCDRSGNEYNIAGYPCGYSTRTISPPHTSRCRAWIKLNGVEVSIIRTWTPETSEYYWEVSPSDEEKVLLALLLGDYDEG